MQTSLSLLSRCMDLPGRGSTARCFFAVFLSGRSGSNLLGATGVSAPSPRRSSVSGGSDSESPESDDSFDNIHESVRLTFSSMGSVAWVNRSTTFRLDANVYGKKNEHP